MRPEIKWPAMVDAAAEDIVYDGPLVRAPNAMLLEDSNRPTQTGS